MEDPRVQLKIILKLIFKKLDWGAWTGFIWLRMWKDGWLL